ncbi:MAG: hypothetical protein A4E42_00709 [Methanoregulaceae archaeon PtaU1.Bin222]|nr:MAG: hypothetical protein A4E42_00709 [Methanoregulaceae archaeon PtaU1.Bin222]
MIVPPVVMARVSSSAVAPSADRRATDPRSIKDPGVHTTMLENLAMEFFPARSATGDIWIFRTGCMHT